MSILWLYPNDNVILLTNHTFNNIILMIDNDQSTIIEAPEVYKSIPTHSPTAKPTTECT